MADTRQHVGHHWTQASPRDDTASIDAWKVAARPTYQRLDAISSNIGIQPINFRRSRHPEPISSKSTGDDLRVVIKQANPRRALLAVRIIEVDRYGVAFDRIDVDPIAQHGRELSAGDTRTDDNAVHRYLLQSSPSLA